MGTTHFFPSIALGKFSGEHLVVDRFDASKRRDRDRANPSDLCRTGEKVFLARMRQQRVQN
jgi:hypothetical protein